MTQRQVVETLNYLPFSFTFSKRITDAQHPPYQGRLKRKIKERTQNGSSC